MGRDGVGMWVGVGGWVGGRGGVGRCVEMGLVREGGGVVRGVVRRYG